jgi:hypothetical protein
MKLYFHEFHLSTVLREKNNRNSITAALLPLPFLFAGAHIPLDLKHVQSLLTEFQK